MIKNKHQTFILAIVLNLCIITYIKRPSSSEITEGLRLARRYIDNEDEKCGNLNVTPIQFLHQFYDYLNPTNFVHKCNKLGAFGSDQDSAEKKFFIDGMKRACLDPGYSLIPGKCLVFSYGFNNDFEFEDAMSNHGCKLQTFEGMSKISNLKDRHIDYMKMDIEGDEVDFFNSVLSKGNTHLLNKVKQIAVEIHPSKPKIEYIDNELHLAEDSLYNVYWKIFKKLECLGFKLVFNDVNTYEGNTFNWNNTVQSCCYELLWINMAYL